MCVFAIIILFNVFLISVIPGPEQSQETWILQKYSQLSFDLDRTNLENLPWQAELSKVCKRLELLRNNSVSVRNNTLEDEESFVTKAIKDIRDKHSVTDKELLINKTKDLFLFGQQ